MSHVSGDALREYLRVFHHTLRDTADRYLPAGHSSRTTHLSQLPARVVGYVSTQHGVAIDYDPLPSSEAASEPVIEIVSGSARVEELVLRHAGAPRAMIEAPPVFDVVGANYVFAGIHIGGRVRLGSQGHAILDRCLFTWTLPGGRRWTLGTSWLELYGDRSADQWTVAKAVERAKDEILAAQFEYQRAQSRGISLREYYARHREKTVLLLGSYSEPGRARLRAVASALTRLGYEPILISDVPDQDAQTLEQKVVMVGSLSRFVILDDSERAGQLAELPLCKSNGWITVVLQEGGRSSSAMSAAASALSNVILELPYSAGAIADVVPAATEWAEKRHGDLKYSLRHAYPWIIPRE
jgi:hypothetical protein